MATISLKGKPCHTVAEPPVVGATPPAFELVRQDLSTARLADYRGRRKVLNVFPSLDTPTCAASVRTFSEQAASREGTSVLNVSMDLPFAAKRFCASEGISGAETLSAFRSTFPDDWGLRLADGPLAGLCARAVFVLDEQDRVLHAQLVPEIAQEPDYEAAWKAVERA